MKAHARAAGRAAEERKSLNKNIGTERPDKGFRTVARKQSPHSQYGEEYGRGRQPRDQSENRAGRLVFRRHLRPVPYHGDGHQDGRLRRREEHGLSQGKGENPSALLAS